MGAGSSQITYVLEMYQKTSGDQCVLPDVGIDESLLKYSGTDSNAVLQAYSNEMVNQVPRHSSDINNNLKTLIHQNGSYILPSEGYFGFNL
ncbi:Dihydroxy-acid dehydratase [Dissostichus eleginoides]|uniref:Dihydroxy-acid dehydratase n=1 Tax=Dissostichus eleginoides TaxID=100907 RepID=A0AAD9CJZ8_DISEL|nr:Dihydroxy-acid dehydratase [Dissostichus eleginoides]